MKFVRKSALMLCCVLMLSHSALGTMVVDYDGSVAPSANDPVMSFVVFGGTTWSTANNLLTLTTAHVRGIWFGYGNHLANVNDAGFAISPNPSGSHLSLRAKLSDLATDWSMYIHDGTSTAGFLFQHDRVTFGSADESFEVLMDTTDDFHHFEILLKDELVNFRIDGVSYGTGDNAVLSTANQILLIGDGSGSTPTGSGSMMIDHFIYNNEVGAIIPEPTTATLLLMGSLVLAGRRSRA